MAGFHNYNNWWIFSDHHRVISDLAKHDVVCTTESMDSILSLSADVLKAINPNIKLLRHMEISCVNSWDKEPNRSFPIGEDEIEGNDWWLRYSDGSIVTITAGNWSYRVVDVGKDGVAERFAACAIERLPTSFEGWTWDYLLPNLFWHTGGRAPANYQTERQWQEEAWKPYFAAINEALAQYVRIGNMAGYLHSNDPMHQFQRNYVSGVIQEAWAYDSEISHIYSSELPKRIYSLLMSPLIECISDYNIGETDTYKQEKRLGSLAAYLVGFPSSSPLYCRRYFGLRTYGSDIRNWFSAYDLAKKLGKPSQYLKIIKYKKQIVRRLNTESADISDFGSGVYIRNYEGGIAVVNFTEDDYELKLPKQFTIPFLNQRVRQITIEPRKGMVAVF